MTDPAGTAPVGAGRAVDEPAAHDPAAHDPAAHDPAARDPVDDAAAFAALFRALYLTYHRRDGPRSGLTGASRAVLGHLAHTGPLTIGEAALHLQRAQSVVSEIVDGLARRGLLLRDRDPADRRRTLVWLTPAGTEALRRDGEVLAEDTLAAAFARMTASDRDALLTGAAALLAAAPPPERPLRKDP